MEVFGPLRHLWCMHFEACHQYYNKVAKISNNYSNIALTLAERHQFKQCWVMSGDNALVGDVLIGGKQSTTSVAALPMDLQLLLNQTFSIPNSSTVLSVKSVHLGCVSLCVDEYYVTDIISDYELPAFMQLKYIVEHEGAWILCGLLNVSQQYDKDTDTVLVQSCDEYIALSPSELKTHGPVACVDIKGMKYVSLSYRIVA